MSLLSPKTLLAIKDLQLVAKTVIDGFMTGANRSSIKGPGLEFSQYRSYQPGDDLRWLDWKMFARSDRYYIRESEVDTSISVRFVVDASASMAHPDSGLTKMDYARFLTASLAWLAALQGDAVGLYTLQQGDVFALSPKQGLRYASRLFYQLEQLVPGGNFTGETLYKPVFAGSRNRELVIVVTDLYERNNEIMQMLDMLSALKNEVLVFHLLGRNELDMEFTGFTTLEDLETGEQLEIDPSTKADYQQKMDTHLAQIRLHLAGKNIAYRMVCMDQPLDQALRDFLVQRNKA
ncbi:MAG: DUF58 domain-containing protein [Mucilaginibacter polytrichastri]|nr:DUF58 domain-containing protein [Mucilaginibacter polytrichastri]